MLQPLPGRVLPVTPRLSVLLAGSLLLGPLAAASASEAPARARYRVLPADERRGAPIESVEITLLDPPAGAGPGFAWQLAAFAAEGKGPALVELRCVTRRDPLADRDPGLGFLRYALRIPAAGETVEYRDVHGGDALLPMWHDFERWFLPRPARGTGRDGRFPRTCEYLGHVLTLRGVDSSIDPADLADWKDVRVLALDDELLVGTGRVFKDAEGHRLPQKPERRNYTYVEFTAEDYDAMIAAGLSYFGLVRGIEPSLRSRPVFYRRGPEGEPPLAWPADFYRSNWLGSLMFEDEPACILVGDEGFHLHSRYFSDAIAVLGARIRSQYERNSRAMQKALRDAGTSLGDMVLAQMDYPVWETRYETAWYQLEAGFAGFVHEGRYDPRNFYGDGASFDEYVLASTGIDRKHSDEEMLRYVFAFLRGAARRFGKHWGISIYGQADPKVSPLAVRLAYDMGARYIWFWTSDHDHHLPWNEQLELSRIVARHAAERPRRSIRAAPPVLDTVILVPWGFFPVLESPTKRRQPWDLWWVRELDREGASEASVLYRARMRALLTEVHRALDAGEDFDIAVDDGREVRGYRRIVHLESPAAPPR